MSVFGRRKKDKEVIGTPCPFCEHLNDLGAQQCVQCYYEFAKPARDQPMAPSTTPDNEIMALLLGENEAEEDEGPAVEAVLSMDDVTVDVDQYAVTSETDDDDTAVANFEYIESVAPTLATTVPAQETTPANHDLRPEDALTETVAFDLPDVDPLDEVAEPVHTGQGGVYFSETEPSTDADMSGSVGPSPETVVGALPDLPDDEEPERQVSLAAAAVTDEPEVPDVPDVPDMPDWPVEAAAAEPEPVATPDIPDLPFDDEPTPSVPTAQHAEAEVEFTPDLPFDDDPTPTVPTAQPAGAVGQSTTPDLPDVGDESEPSLPDLPEDEPVSTPNLPEMDDTMGEVVAPTPAASATEDHRMWPWPAAEAWSNQQVYQAVIAAMEHVKHGRLPAAASALDELGPHLDHHLDMLPHVTAIMVHIGRKQHAEWTVNMAAHLFGNDPHVEQARAQVPA
jgi:hypothetical protein